MTRLQFKIQMSRSTITFFLGVTTCEIQIGWFYIVIEPTNKSYYSQFQDIYSLLKRLL
jgi:hypothetical protein